MALSDRGAVILLAVLFVAQYSGASASFNPVAGIRRLLSSHLFVSEADLAAAKQQHRRLLGPVTTTSSTTVKGSTGPSVKSSQNYTEASSTSSTSVKSEKPAAKFTQDKPAQTVTTTSSTTFNGPQAAKYTYKTGEDGTQIAFDSGKRAFDLTHTSATTVNFPSSTFSASGGTPFVYTSSRSVALPVKQASTTITSGSGPSFSQSSGFTIGSGKKK